MYHIPVLLHECIEALQLKADGIYVDATFGGGGHSKEMLKLLGKNGKLIVFDQDPDAAKNVPDDDRIIFVAANFRHLKRFLKLHQCAQVDGILADLGVSSYQFDTGERGFSYRFEGPLDMRMNVKEGVTAADILNTYDEKALQQLLSEYGEVTNSKTHQPPMKNAAAAAAKISRGLMPGLASVLLISVTTVTGCFMSSKPTNLCR